MSFAHGLRPEFRFPNGLYINTTQLSVHEYVASASSLPEFAIPVSANTDTTQFME